MWAPVPGAVLPQLMEMGPAKELEKGAAPEAPVPSDPAARDPDANCACIWRSAQCARPR